MKRSGKLIIVNVEAVEERKKLSGFKEYILNRYKERGKRALRSSQGLDELDTLLAIKRSSKFDEEDEKYLNKSQLKELERLRLID